MTDDFEVHPIGTQKRLDAMEWLFMIVGALLVPVAVVHGWSIWLGFDWLN